MLRAALLFSLALFSAKPIANSGPNDIVGRFCELDMSGARLESSAESPIWQITVDNGEPPSDPVVLVKKYSIVHTQVGTSKARVSVAFDVLGVISGDGDHVVPSHSAHASRSLFVLSREATGWKIRLDEFHEAPHTSVSSYLSHVQQLIRSIDAGSKEPAVTRKLAGLKGLESELERLK